MKYLLLFILVFSVKAQASCEELYADYKALMSLSPERDVPFNCQTFDVNHLLPSKITQLLNTTPQYFGPNCWNSVLFLSGMTNDIRYSIANEMLSGLEYFQCRQLKRNETLAPGDIVRLKDHAQEDIHAFYFITQNISFSKNGPATLGKYELKKVSQIFNDYNFDPSCLPNDKISATCTQYVSAYRCPKITDPDMNDMYAAQIESISRTVAEILSNYRVLRTTDSFYPRLQILKSNIMFIRQSLRHDYLAKNLEIEYYERQLSILDSLEAQINFF